MEIMSNSKVLHPLPLLVFEYGANAESREGMLMFKPEQSIHTGDLPEIMVAGEVSEVWLWHPLTGETISLPPIHDDHYIPVNCKCLLTHKSVTDPNCTVVLLRHRPKHMVLQGQRWKMEAPQLQHWR